MANPLIRGTTKRSWLTSGMFGCGLECFLWCPHYSTLEQAAFGGIPPEVDPRADGQVVVDEC